MQVHRVFGGRTRQLLVVAGGLVATLSAQAQSRGELLYSTHCVGCHTTEVHWRDQTLANDWAGIVVQVRKWQSANSLAWNEQDVLAVARYLNNSFYHYTPPAASQPAASASSPISIGWAQPSFPRRSR